MASWFSCCVLTVPSEHDAEEQGQRENRPDSPQRTTTTTNHNTAAAKSFKAFKTPRSNNNNNNSNKASSFTFGSGMRWSSSKAESYNGGAEGEGGEHNSEVSGDEDNLSTHGARRSSLGVAGRRNSLLGQPPAEPTIVEEE